jgi:hypothetical protein
MKIDHLHPDFSDFAKNELSTLNYLATDAYIAQKFPELSERASTQYYNYYATRNKKGNYSQPFSFGSTIRILIEGQFKTVLIECQVARNFNPTNFVLSIVNENEGTSTLIRKFHFDYALPDDNKDKKPVYHIQYGGTATPGLSALKVNMEPVHPWLSSPRIFYTPMNLCLIFDSLFCEFPSEETNHITEAREWRELVKRNEDHLLRSFYSNLSNFLNHTHSSDRLIRDFYYGG